ncbi:MAG: cupin domain-containing protein [Acidimicrobiia bacterium]
MGAVSSQVKVVPLDSVDPIELPKDSWSRMVVTASTVPEPTSSMGYSVFRPGMETGMVSHEVEEIAFVVQGRGELRLEDSVLTYGPGEALYIPQHTWHAVANTGEEDVVMIFTFPHPDYPPTERR